MVDELVAIGVNLFPRQAKQFLRKGKAEKFVEVAGCIRPAE
jgi:hypothetical protein